MNETPSHGDTGQGGRIREELYEEYALQYNSVSRCAVNTNQAGASRCDGVWPRRFSRPNTAASPTKIIVNGSCPKRSLIRLYIAGEEQFTGSSTGSWTVDGRATIGLRGWREDEGPMLCTSAVVVSRRGTTGLAGKGVQVAGILLTTGDRRRRRAVWISKSDKLMRTRQREPRSALGIGSDFW